MTGPAAEMSVPQYQEGSAAVAELVRDGFDDWLLAQLDGAGPAGMSLAEIQMAVWRRYGRMVGGIFLQGPCDRLEREGRIAAGPTWTRFRKREAQTPAAASGAAGDEGQEP